MLCIVSAEAKTKKASAPVQRTQEEIRNEQELKYYFYQAMEALDQSRYDETLALLMHCEMINPDDAAVCHYLGILYGALNQRERSFAYTEKAFRLCPTEYWYAYCVQLFQSGDKQKQQTAIRTLEDIADLLPENEEVQETLQQMYINTGDTKKAIRQQDRIDAISGISPYGAVQRFQLYAQNGQNIQARKAITDYLKEDPDNYYLQVLLGDMELNQGHQEEAWKQLSNVRKNYPENPYLSLSLANYYGRYGSRDSAAYFERQLIDNDNVDLDYKLGILKQYKWLTYSEGAEEAALKSLVNQYPQEEGAASALAQYYIDQKQDSLAEPVLWTVLDINPRSDRALQSLLTLLQSDTATTDEAYEKLVRKGIEARPEQKQWYYLMAMLYMRREQPDSAIHILKEGLKQPEEVDLRYKIASYIQLGDVYMKLNQCDSAYSYYEAALAYDPENAYVLNNYAYFLAINGGDLRKAEKMSARCIKKVPDNPSYLDTYAWILHLEGQDLLARFYMQQAWDKSEDKDDPDLVEHYRIIVEGKTE